MKKWLMVLFLLLAFVPTSQAIVIDFQSMNLTPDVTTVDNSSQQRAQWIFDANSSTIVEVKTLAVSSTGTTAYWDIIAVVKADSSQTPTIVNGSVTNLITPIKDLGALLWNFSLVPESGSPNYIAPVVTGGASTTINWYIEVSFKGMHDN